MFIVNQSAINNNKKIFSFEIIINSQKIAKIVQEVPVYSSLFPLIMEKKME